jgi:DNA-directed RNA polymerase alpha subunit
MFSDDTQIDAINLPARLRNALARAVIRTAGDVRNLSDVDLFKLPGVGRSSLRMLRMLGPSLDGGAALLPSG